MNIDLLNELLKNQMLGNKRREEEFISVIKDLMEYLLDHIDASKKEAIITDSLSWVMENIMNLEETEDFIPWIVQIVCINAMEEEDEFLQDSLSGFDHTGVSYPYTRVEQDVECFIPKDIQTPLAIDMIDVIWKEKDKDLRLLGMLFFAGEMSLQEITEATEGKIEITVGDKKFFV